MKYLLAVQHCCRCIDYFLNGSPFSDIFRGFHLFSGGLGTLVSKLQQDRDRVVISCQSMNGSGLPIWSNFNRSDIQRRLPLALLSFPGTPGFNVCLLARAVNTEP
jgi:hypothetical protein